MNIFYGKCLIVMALKVLNDELFKLTCCDMIVLELRSWEVTEAM